MTHAATKLFFRGIHEVCRKRIGGGVSHVGYFDNAEDVFKAVEHDNGYEAIWLSLNPIPAVPDGFTTQHAAAIPQSQHKRLVRTAHRIADRFRSGSQERREEIERHRRRESDRAETS